MTKAEKINRHHCAGIEELKSVTTLNELSGDYIDLECRWPNVTRGNILNDNTKYLAAQIEREEDDRCYSVAADDKQIAVYSCGCKGRDAVTCVMDKIAKTEKVWQIETLDRTPCPRRFCHVSC